MAEGTAEAKAGKCENQPGGSGNGLQISGVLGDVGSDSGAIT